MHKLNLECGGRRCEFNIRHQSTKDRGRLVSYVNDENEESATGEINERGVCHGR